MDKQIEQQVEMLKKYAPEKYKRFQLIGESLMSMEYDNIQKGVDWEGDPILGEEILNRMLERLYGKDWKDML
jgi:hypothetical protein